MVDFAPINPPPGPPLDTGRLLANNSSLVGKTKIMLNLLGSRWIQGEIFYIDLALTHTPECRFQVNTNITRFLGVTLWKGQLYHILGSLKCNLRQVLAHATQVTPETADTTKFKYLQEKMVQVVRGLDYLHERGWVHFDLSMDTVAVSTKR